MNRRNFLKRLAAVAVGAVVVPTIAKQLEAGRGDRHKHIVCGVTVEQAMELVKMTLDDMPQSAFESVWEFDEKFGRHYANNAKNNLCHTTQH